MNKVVRHTDSRSHQHLVTLNDQIVHAPVHASDASYIASRAEGIGPMSGFGATRDYETVHSTVDCNLLHANFCAASVESGTPYGVVVGNRLRGSLPFEIRSALNIAPMSLGGINIATARILGLGAADNCFINSGEGGLVVPSASKADTILQIGTAKIGLASQNRGIDGTSTFLDETKLISLIAKHPHIRAIQLKISQGAKPGSVVLPAQKISPAIAQIRGINTGQAHFSQRYHSEVEASTSRESMLKMLLFISRIRQLTGLPVAIKISMGHPLEFRELTQLMAEHDQFPDMITLDGADGGTSAAQDLVANYVGYGSVYSAIHCMDKLLRRAGLREKIVLSASGKLYSPVRALQAFALGAETIETARGFLIALGCNQCRECHTGNCSYKLTSCNEPDYSSAQEIVLSKKVSNYIRGFNDDLITLTKIAGLRSPLEIQPYNFRGSFLKNIVLEIEEFLI